ncbi:MAG: hypothetical protein RQ735_03020 [Flavobacteriaceae bacterium]|nr:hypothetical protein [Flavobacteriaceae bacterium]
MNIPYTISYVFYEGLQKINFDLPLIYDGIMDLVFQPEKPEQLEPNY